MDFKPLYDKIVVIEITENQQSGGLFIPSTVNSFKKGEVVAAGPGNKGEVMVVCVGQQVLYRKEDATDITIEGQNYKLLLERNIWLAK